MKQYQCEIDDCGRPAVNEIITRDPELEEIGYTMRCEPHTYLEDDPNADVEIRSLKQELTYYEVYDGRLSRAY